MHLKTGGMKIALYGCVLIVSMLFSSCMKTEMKETGTKNTDKTGQTDNADSVKDTADELIDGIDMTYSRCQLRISDKFMIDAEITPYDVYKDGLGLYDYSANPENINDEEDLKRFVKNVDDYYGKDVTITQSEYIARKTGDRDHDCKLPVSNIYALSEERIQLMFSNTYMYQEKYPENGMEASDYALGHLYIDSIKKFYPFFSPVNAEDMEKIDKGTDAAFKMLAGIVDREKFNHMQIMNIDDAHYDAVAELYDKAGQKQMFYGNNEIFNNREKYYMLRLTPELDGGIPVDRPGELSLWKITGKNLTDEEYALIYKPSMTDIAINDEGEIIKLDVYLGDVIENMPYDRADIIDIKKVLGLMYSRYKKKKLIYEIKVIDVYLTYAVGLRGDVGNDEYCLKPYWVINYLGNTVNGSLSMNASQHIYDAVTGEYVSGAIADH